MISEQAILTALLKYSKTKSGQAKIAKNLPKDKTTALARELRKDIINAYYAVVADSEAKLDVKRITVGTPKLNKTTNQWYVEVKFADGVLSRPSLLSPNKTGHTGRGVYDIFGLLTQGYEAKSVYGIWQGHNSDNPIRSKRVRRGNPFITTTINQFQAKHPGVTVRYPTLWGGFGVEKDNGLL